MFFTMLLERTGVTIQEFINRFKLIFCLLVTPFFSHLCVFISYSIIISSLLLKILYLLNLDKS